MPSVPVPVWGEEPPIVPEGNFEDMLLTPVRPPEPDPEQTPEEFRHEVFHEEAGTGDSYANQEPGDFHRAGRNMSEVCVMSGWPPRHLQIGRHCPHGLNRDTGKEEIVDYT